MVILGIDPGKTTGWALLKFAGYSSNTFLSSVESGQITCDDSYKDYALWTLLLRRNATTIAIEQVIQFGHLNKAKITQVVAQERILLAIHNRKVTVPAGKINVIYIPPQQTKLYSKIGKLKVPNTVTGKHARDAFRVAALAKIKEDDFYATNTAKISN